MKTFQVKLHLVVIRFISCTATVQMLVKRLVTHNVTDGKYMMKLNGRSVADGRQAIIFWARWQAQDKSITRRSCTKIWQTCDEFFSCYSHYELGAHSIAEVAATLRQNISGVNTIVYHQLYAYLEDHDIICKYQSGFRDIHSTVMALLEATDTSAYNIDHCKINAVVFQDLKKRLWTRWTTRSFY